MRFIRSIIQKWVKNEKKVLGRWNIEYCDKKMNNKIDLSNEDHCGPCGQYILNKNKHKSLNDDNKPSKHKN
jgi:hypothetical protein